MPKTSEMLDKKFLGKDDLPGPGLLLTVVGVKQMPVGGKDDDDDTIRWCLLFHETDKPLVMRTTLIHLCQDIFGSDETDEWIGRKIVVFVDPTVQFGGKIVGGVRVRKPKKPAPVESPAAPPLAPVPPPAARPVVEDIYDDEIPF